MLSDLRHHLRFMLSFALGLAIGLGYYWGKPVDRLLLFSVGFSLTYLLLTMALIRNITADFMRGRADVDDEGMLIIVPLAIGSVAISLFAILLTIRNPHDGMALRPVLALVSVPLGWAMVHTVMAFHYSSMWFVRGQDGRDARNLGFPGLRDDQDAGIWDFLYYSFTLGMAAQTADVTTLDSRVRRVTVLHSAFAFYYNTVLLALAVNAGMSLGQ